MSSSRATFALPLVLALLYALPHLELAGPPSRWATQPMELASASPGPGQSPSSKPNRSAPPSRRAFVAVQGTSFVLRGSPFTFLGANVGVMHGPTERLGYRRTLAAVKADGLRVVRVWAMGEGASNAPPWHRRWHLFRAGPRGWIQAAPRHLDRVLAEARRLHLRVILTLANNWSAYGGVPMYLRWARLGTATYGAADRFFVDPRIRRWFRLHVLRLVQRRSSITGLRYSQDPTIMAWELFNESRATSAGFAARRKMIRRMARLIRKHAPHQLISAGVSEYRSIPVRQEWLRVCRLPELDFCDAHLYPGESWRLRRPKDLDDVVDDRVQLARYVARKPIIFGEFGFSEEIHKRRGLRGRSQRWWVSRFLRRARYDGASGALIWLYLPHSRNRRRYPVWVDRRSSLPLRRVLRRWASRFRRGPLRRTNPRLGSARGTRPMYQTRFKVTRNPPSHRWRILPPRSTPGPERRRVDLPVMDFFQARFSDVGYYGAGWLEHVYGAGHGYLDYRVPRLRTHRRVVEVALWLRLSSEYPGATAPPGGISLVTLKLAGRVVARLRVAPDDGMGRPVHVRVTDPLVTASLRRRRVTLRLEVGWGKLARGVCVYGRLGVGGLLKGLKPKGFLGAVRVTATLATAPKMRYTHPRVAP